MASSTASAASKPLTARDVKRLLARHRKLKKTIYAPFGPPDLVIERVMRGGSVKGGRIQLNLDPKLIPDPKNKELLCALGEEAKRWLAEVGIETRSYSVGSLRPYYFLWGKKSRERCALVLPQLRRRR